MSKPPKEIDGATVIEWAWSGEKRFGIVGDETGERVSEIFGLAICCYPNDQKIYRFSCNFKWETEQDSDYRSLEEAKSNLPLHYQEVKPKWQKYE